ncbi:unnamed protein product [Vitrella brassicaformis CCMP3155]|uniref:Uncharacterized protein n=2 Tax=Vitrella brassicaformis TaxID=1169539 RepID=A0A0G4FU78_VITBC|nr:unnamed protein product [Vitrella brassicaformis CCMP3155]|eukprot:CEM18462.1 unnamed protein product [Vitrella brassicaformis CCMP3155]
MTNRKQRTKDSADKKEQRQSDTGDPPTLPLKGVGGSQKASGVSSSCGMSPPTASEACVDNQDSLSTECDSDGACSSHSQTTTNTHGRSGNGLDDRSLTASPIRDPLQAPTTDSCKPAGAGGGGGEILDQDADGPSSSSCSSTAASRRSRHSLSQHFLLNCKGVGLGMGELGDIQADGRDEDGGTSSGDDGHGGAVGGASFPLTPSGGNGSVKTAQQGVQATAPLAGAAGRKGKEGGGGGKGGSGKGDEGDDKGGGTSTSASASASASAAATKGGGASVANMQIKTNHAANANPSLGASASASASAAAAAAAAMPPPRATRLTEPDYRRITYYSNRVKTALGRVLAHQATLRAGAQTGGGGGGGGGEEGGGGASAAAAAPAGGGGGDCGGKGKGGKAKKGDK